MVKIIIENLSFGTAIVTIRDLKPLFELYGTVTECEVMDNQGYGWVLLYVIISPNHLFLKNQGHT